MNIKTSIANFMELTRMYSLSTILASCIVVFSYAFYSEKFSFLNFILLIIALCCLNLGENLYDDYIDVRKKIKSGISLENVIFNAYVPKARLITNGTYSIKQVLIIIATLFLIPVLIGVYFFFISGWQVLIYAFIGALLTLFYPYSSKFYLAEITVAMIYGPLMIMGGYFALTGMFDVNLLIISFAVSCATLSLLHTHSLMDWELDIKENKKTLCMLLKTKENALKLLVGIISCAYIIIVIAVLSNCINPKALYAFLALPICTKLIDSMQDYINVKDVKFKPKWYYGLFENWDMIKQNNIEFFMYRFYLARNFSLFFAIFLSIGVTR